MPKYIAVIPFLKCASHREVEADNRDDAILRAMREAYNAGRWGEGIPGPDELHFRDSNDCEDSGSSLAWDIATRSWGGLDKLARDVGSEQADLIVQAWEQRYCIATVSVFGPVAE